MRKNLPVTRSEHILPDGASLVSKTDPNGRITYANPAFVEASGFSRDELMGAAHSIVRHPDMPEAAFADMWATIQEGKPWSGLVKNRRKDGDFYWVRANVTPVVEKGRVVGYMSVRDKPSRESIAAAEGLYRAMREGKLEGVDLREGRLRRRGLPGFFAHFADRPLGSRILMASVLAALFLVGEAVLASAGAPSRLVTVWAALGASLSLGAGVLLRRATDAPSAEALVAVRGLLAGSVGYRTTTERVDAAGLLQSGLQQLSINLTAVVQDIQSGSGAIQDVTGTLSEEMNSLAERTQTQAASLEETAASMVELTATMQATADSARQVNDVVVEAAGLAARAGRVAGRVVHVMDAISNSSKKIRDIIAVIDEIAFHTNILALNAAVEAAKAGDEGRGFAVVASEVRSLAQRSGLAAREIKALIVDSVERVDEGAPLVGEAGQLMDQLSAAVDRVAGLMGQIVTSSREQSVGLDQISEAVARIDQITQQNAALVVEANGATAVATEHTRWLNDAVDVFNVPRAAPGVASLAGLDDDTGAAPDLDRARVASATARPRRASAA
jgi:aerotaxis receptor